MCKLEAISKIYSSNLTWELWELIAELFPEAKLSGRSQKVSIYAVVNAII
ncbi:MAG: hypothetical protein AAF208_05055 [Cyanobacteria bacterium P01_A01_bin.45]